MLSQAIGGWAEPADTLTRRARWERGDDERGVPLGVLAVATGWHSDEELAAHEPDVLLRDLSDRERVMATCGIA